MTSKVISTIAAEVGAPPYKLGGKEIMIDEATEALHSDSIVTFQAFCYENALLCSSQDLWVALFHERFPELYPVFQEVSEALFNDGVVGVNPFPEKGSYEPLFWRDSHTDLFNMPPDLIFILEKLINSEPVEEDELGRLPEIFQDFWTIGVVLANIDPSRNISVLSMLIHSNNLLPYVFFPEDAVLRDALNTELDRDSLGKGATLFALDNKMSFSPIRMFRSAVRLGHLKVVELLLGGIVDSRVDPSSSGNLAIYDAARNGHTEVVKILLGDERVDPSFYDYRSLKKAIKNGHTDVVVLLMKDDGAHEAGLDTLLFRLASTSGHTGVLQVLLADDRIDIANVARCNTMQWASTLGHTGAVRVFLEDGRLVTKESLTRDLRSAIGGGHDGVVSLLLVDGRAELGKGALAGAIESGNASVVELILEDKRTDPSVKDSYAMWRAAYWANSDIMELLLADKRADPTAVDYDAVMMSIKKGNADILRMLLEDGRFDPTFNQNQLIWGVAKSRNSEAFRLLFADKRVDPTAVENRAILAAFLLLGESVAKLLLADKRVDPSVRDSEALRKASQSGNVALVKLLLADGRVDPTAKNNEAFYKASNNDHMEVVRLLTAQEGLNNRKAYTKLSRVVLGRLARDRGLKVNAGLNKEQLLTMLFSPTTEARKSETKKRGASLKVYDGMFVKELRREARTKGVPGRSKMNKAALIVALKGE